jgi:predicted glycogen debranching enzyme
VFLLKELLSREAFDPIPRNHCLRHASKQRETMINAANDTRQEWLEADGLGGFASGTASGIRTRRYHALLLSATTPPTGRQVLVGGFDAELTSEGHTVALSSQQYVPGITTPDGASRVERFENDPWPRWTYRLSERLRVEHSLFVPKGLPITVMRWQVVGEAGAPRETRLRVRLFLAGRDYHSTHHENDVFRFDAALDAGVVRWRPYEGVPGIAAWSNGSYIHQPDWYRRFEYREEQARGLDAVEDLACPGAFEWDITADDAVLILARDTRETAERLTGPPFEIADGLARDERQRRAALATTAERAGDAYLVRRGSGHTVIAGYPWFTDWGRDTFIALRGLCLATGRYEEALGILLEWASAVSAGMLPNRFSDAGEQPEFNAADASLWFIVAAHELLQADPSIALDQRDRLRSATEEILEGYSRGTRYGIRADTDGLLAAGAPGVQLTWMDARVGDRVITPRIGKPVELQALWINALWVAARFADRWKTPFLRAFTSFERRFWNDAARALYDVVDVDHVPGVVDSACRPNQIFAVGGLPLQLIEGDRARALVDQVERRLWTPVGLRSLAPDEPGYCGRYGGDPSSRDAAYHQGTVWPWLLGAFVEAWVRTRGDSEVARGEARQRFLEPLTALTSAHGGHLPEVADGDPPHAFGGCPFQAWSVGEVLRLHLKVLRTGTATGGVADARRPSAEEVTQLLV